MNSTQRVVENHIQRFREGDLDGVLEDFSPEAIVFTPSGTLKGKSEIKTLFQNLLEEFGKAGASETVRTAIFEGDYAYLIWREKQWITTMNSQPTHICRPKGKDSHAIFRCEGDTKAVIRPRQQQRGRN